jgi:hypothetical protein
MSPFRILAAIGLEDGAGVDDIFWFAAGATTVIVFVTLLFRKPLRSLLDFIRWMGKFREDWDGVTGDAGHVTIPGVMQRMNSIDGEVNRNGGNSMKDVVVSTSEAVTKLAVVVERLDSTLISVTEKVDGMEKRQVSMETIQGEIKKHIDTPTPSEKA